VSGDDDLPFFPEMLVPSIKGASFCLKPHGNRLRTEKTL